MSEVVLQTERLVKRFGGITATNDVSLSIERGARHALIGPNGAGKTTLINLLTGVLRADRGPRHARRRATSPSWRRTSASGCGMVRTFQINQLFDDLTPLQSLALAVSQPARRRRGAGGGRWAATRAIADECEQLLRAVPPRRRMPTSRRASCAYGKRRLLEIAMALALRAARAAARRAGRRRARRRARGHSATPWRRCRPTCRCC